MRRVYVWMGRESSAVLQRQAHSLAIDYVRHAPDGRPAASAGPQAAAAAVQVQTHALYPARLATRGSNPKT